MEAQIKDFRGLVIGTGDLIAYPRRRGSLLWMQHGTVKDVLFTGELDITNEDGKSVRILRSDRCAVLGRN